MMQPLRDGPRSHLTRAQVISLIENSDSMEIDRGLELIDQNLAVLEDISDTFLGGTVERYSYAILHGRASLVLSRPLDWGTAIVRPYLTISDGVTTARFNLGAYYTDVPEHTFGKPYEVNAVDILDRLYDPVGTSFSIPKNAGYLDAAEDVILSRGYPPGTFLIDPRDRFKTLPGPKTWALSEGLTWLRVVNEIANTMGYRGVWSDWNGRLRLGPYVQPSKRSVEWQYTTADLRRNIVQPERSITTDLYRVPNRWLVHRTNMGTGAETPNPVEATPVLGAGIAEYINHSLGPTSVEARGGRVITRVVGVESADQKALVRRARSIAEGDIDTTTKVAVTTGLNPLQWHFDRIDFEDPEGQMGGPMMVTAWTLPLSPGVMEQAWSLVDSVATEEDPDAEEGEV